MDRTKPKRRPASVEPTSGSAVFSSLFGLIAALITFIALTAAFSFVSLLCPDPRAVSRFLGYAVLYISSVIGGIVAYKRCGGYPLICGLSFGVLYALINWLLSLLFSPTDAMNIGIALIMRVLSVAAAVGGAFLGSYKPKRKHRGKRKR